MGKMYTVRTIADQLGASYNTVRYIVGLLKASGAIKSTGCIGQTETFDGSVINKIKPRVLKVQAKHGRIFNNDK